jgi:hypothetical protein
LRSSTAVVAQVTISAFLRRRWWAAATTTETAAELGVEAARTGCALLVSLLTTSVSALATLTIATWATAAAWATLTITSHHAAWWSVRTLLLDVGLGDDLSW